MTPSPLAEYVRTVDPAAVPVVTALHAAITDARPGLDVAVKYRMLTFTIDRNWRHWLCAVSTTKRAVNLRFLDGTGIDDPLGVLRAGTSTLMTWDIPRDGVVDPDAVADYVRAAVAVHPGSTAIS